MFSKDLRFVAVLILCMSAWIPFTACSDDDGNSAVDGDELLSIIVGAWAQDGDNDIFVVNADGTGMVYDTPQLYEEKRDGASFSWTYSDGWVKAGIAGVQEEELRVVTCSQNTIVWKRYESSPSSSDIQAGYYEKDAFGYYELWTWERYTK